MVTITRTKSSRFVIFLTVAAIVFFTESTSMSMSIAMPMSAPQFGNLSSSHNQSSSSNSSSNSSSTDDDEEDEYELWERWDVKATSLVHSDGSQDQDHESSFTNTVHKAVHVLDEDSDEDNDDSDDEKDQSATTKRNQASTQAPKPTPETTKEQSTTPPDLSSISVETTTDNIKDASPQPQSPSQSPPEPATEQASVSVDQISTSTVQSTTSQNINNAQNPTTFISILFSQFPTNATETNTSTHETQIKIQPAQNYNSSFNNSNFPSTTTMSMILPANPSTGVPEAKSTTENSQASTPTNTQTQKIESTLSTTQKTVLSQTQSPNSSLTQVPTQNSNLSSTPDSNATIQQPSSSSPSFNTTDPNDSKQKVYNLSYSCSFKSSQNLCEKVTAKIPKLPFSKTRHGFFNHTPKFFIHPKNICVKNLTIEICGQQLTSASTSDPDSGTALINYGYAPTLQKCCPMGAVVTMNTSRKSNCLNSGKTPPWKPGNFMKTNQSEIRIYPNYHFSSPKCDSVIRILPYQLESQLKSENHSRIQFKDVRVLENGEVETKDSGNHKWRKLEENNYCIDGFYHVNLTRDRFQNFIVLECTVSKSKERKIKDMIFTVTSFISSFVLLIILMVYVLTWSQQNVHGWTSAAFSLSMFLWFFFTGVRLVYKKDGKEDDFCVFIAVATHFPRISVFSWMLIMNFDLWSTISSMRAKSERSKGHMRFLWYCCVALTIPAVVVSISIVIENQFSLFDERVIRPQYGRERCYLDHTAVKAYAIYPTIILFLPNFIFILLTMKIVLGAKKESNKFQKYSNWKAKAAQNEKNRAQIKLYIKLFVIMGISWIFDIVSGLLDTDEVSWYWMITDIYNIAQPFFLFWLFICKRTIREQLSEKYSFFKAGFKWMDVNLPRFSPATKTTTGSGSGTEQNKSMSHETKSTAFTKRNENFA